MTLYFITGNQKKVKEVKQILPNIKQLNIDLTEIQEINPKKIIKEKLKEAFRQNKQNKEFIVEDTSLYIQSMDNLPGPLIKWFLKSMGKEKLYEICKFYNNFNAEAKTIIGYAKNQTEIKFFEGNIKGKITMPRKDNGFGWDPIFMPFGFDKTFSEMTTEEKNKISMRKQATEKLKEYLEKK